MDMRCNIELQSSDSEPSEPYDVVSVPAELMAARLRIVEWQRRIHAALNRLEPRDHGDPPLLVSPRRFPPTALRMAAA